ncbi:MAG: glycosyltransferase family 4 protein [Nitrospirae bacterium]|nr:glycosyltransferase family 4 protein [Nitrospirota bacterium]
MTEIKLTILHTESSTGWGGQEIRIVNEALGMLKRGHRVCIAAPVQSVILRKAGDAGIPSFPLPFRKKNLPDICRLGKIIKREKVDIVNTHSSSDSWVATIAAGFSGSTPLVLRTRHLSTPISGNFLSRLIYNRLPDAVITTGEEIRRRMINVNRFDGGKIVSIPTGVDTERFDPEKVTAGPRSNGFSIGMVSVLRSWKGHKYLLEAAPSILKELPEANFYIVGDGPMSQNIRNMIRELSLEDKVLMLGHRDDIPEILASMDVLVHPSYGHEGVPQSVLQAMAMERPVVASDAGAVREIVIDGKTGFLIEPENPEQIARKVCELYYDPELRTKFGKEGRRLVEQNYSVGPMLDKIESLYERLLKSKKGM